MRNHGPHLRVGALEDRSFFAMAVPIKKGFFPFLVAENRHDHRVSTSEVRSGYVGVEVRINNGVFPFLLRETRLIVASVRQRIAPVRGG